VPRTVAPQSPPQRWQRFPARPPFRCPTDRNLSQWPQQDCQKCRNRTIQSWYPKPMQWWPSKLWIARQRWNAVMAWVCLTSCCSFIATTNSTQIVCALDSEHSMGRLTGISFQAKIHTPPRLTEARLGMFGITAWFLNALRGAIQQGWASGMECEGWVVDAEVKFHLKPLCRRYNSTRVSICQVTSAAGGQP